MSGATSELTVVRTRFRKTIDVLVYFSVALGVPLLVQLYYTTPAFLFYTILVGWMAYVATGVLVARGRNIAYPVALVLSILTLAASLPRPEHYSFFSNGNVAAASTFVAGSIAQALLVILIPVYLVRTRRARASSTGN